MVCSGVGTPNLQLFLLPVIGYCFFSSFQPRAAAPSTAALLSEIPDGRIFTVPLKIGITFLSTYSLTGLKRMSPAFVRPPNKKTASGLEKTLF